MLSETAAARLEPMDGVIVPGGFGSRGWEGKLLACQVARERGIPYLGLCLGMHVVVSEYARNVLGLDGANSTEMDPETPHPVIDLLPEQKEIEDLGGRRGERRAGQPRAPPAPLRGQQPLPPRAGGGGPCRLGHLPGRPARRGRGA